MRLNGGGEVRKEMAALLTTCFDYSQHRFNETTAPRALHAKRQLAPNHRVTQRPLARVVRRFYPATSSERPKPATMFVQLATRALRLTVAAGQATAQQPFDFASHRSQPTLHRRPARPSRSWRRRSDADRIVRKARQRAIPHTSFRRNADSTADAADIPSRSA